ncbi:MAG: hypothetical protein HW419_3708, partial [Deltaproteobacteria bacterium]|nr:hypothetical protein [Deltaproteobacteria bacterium]
GINPAGDQRGCSPPLDSPFDGARSKLRGILDSTYYNRLWGVNVGCRCIGSNCEQNRSSHSGVTVRGINLGRAAHTSFYITWSIRSPRHRRRVDEKSILALPYYYHSGKSGRASTQQAPRCKVYANSCLKLPTAGAWSDQIPPLACSAAKLLGQSVWKPIAAILSRSNQAVIPAPAQGRDPETGMSPLSEPEGLTSLPR